MLIFLVKVIVQGIAERKALKKPETRAETIQRFVTAMRVDDAVMLIALAGMTSDEANLTIDALDNETTERLYTWTEVIKMELQEDFRS